MRHTLSAALVALSCATSLFAQSTPAAVTPAGAPVSIGTPLSLTFYLNLAHPKAAEAKAQSLQTPGSSDYHQFLSTSQFVADYAISSRQLSNIEAQLQNLGFTISYVFPNRLAIEVTGTAGTAQAALGTTLRRVTRNGRTGITPTQAITLPASLQGSVLGVGGLNSLHVPRPMHRVLKSATHQSSSVPAPATLVGGTPGNYLPADFANFYNVNPLYNRGLNGRGTTVGIVTLNNFNTADAFTFWKSINLSVDPNRITKVNVDGGVTASSNNPDGEGETDLDVEYSGGLAPASNLRVYVAPNLTTSNFINGFEAAASENIADTVSTSWGEPELFYFQDVDPLDPSPSETYLLDAFHAVFLEMALQGQSLFAAAGDAGAFDTTRACSPFGSPSPTNPICNSPYAVDSPAADPLVTAAGGTTLPFSFNTRSGLHLFVNKERAWGWDYLSDEATKQGFPDAITLQDVFSVGGGGGVSSYYQLPWYQADVKNATRTVPGQFLTVDFGQGSNVDYILPSNFAGRNLPDLSTNADPESGYQYIQGGMAINFYGGTSFVAPQLNGVNALFIQAFGRVGSVNPALYGVPRSSFGNLTAGDNWGYVATSGYDNATGLGTLDAAQLFQNVQTLAASK